MKTNYNPSLIKDQPHNGWAGILNTGISLQQLVDRLVNKSELGILRNKSLVVNEVSSEFYTAAEENKITPVISDLLNTVVSNSKNGRIHITAERFRDTIVLEIQDRNNYNGYALAYSIKTIEPQATMIGGNISMKGSQQLITTISFSFPNWNYNYEC